MWHEVGHLSKVPVFVELCAGTAALSLRLARSKARPPVSRMGAKTGYADAILLRMGLQAGQGADGYLWCEPDAGVRLLLHAYTDRRLARAAAEVVRGWAEDEPRALWERLKAEGPVKAPEPREVARWVYAAATSYKASTPFSGFVHPEQGGRYGASRADQVRRLDDLPELPGCIVPDATEVDPREVARWAFIANASWRKGDPASGYDPRRAEERPATDTGGRQPALTEALPPRLDALPELPARLMPDASEVEPARLPAGSWVYIDPPYVGTTGYAHDLPRAEVVRLARLWRDAGAHVAISEAEPIAELVADGWHAHELTAERVGQKRTFSKQQREWLTMTRAPRGQLGLWGS